MTKLNLVLATAMATIIGLGTIGNPTYAKQVGQLDELTIRYGQINQTYAVKKDSNVQQAVINLSKDNGSAWITCYMKSCQTGNTVGSVSLQRGSRVIFSTTDASANKSYKLGLTKTYNTGGGSVSILHGTWSPDAY